MVATSQVANAASVPRVVGMATCSGGWVMAPGQLAMFEFESHPGIERDRAISSPDPAPSPPPPRREVSAEREGRAAQVSMPLSLDPPDIDGWREELGHPRPQIVNGVCITGEKWRRRVDGTLGPCPMFTCPRHLGLDVGEPITIGGRRHAELILNRAGEDATMGRRPALPAVPTDGEADEFALHAIARAEAMPETCERDVIAHLRAVDAREEIESATERVTLDVAGVGEVSTAERVARDVDAVRVSAIATHLGVSEEQIRQDTLSGAEKLGIRMINGQPHPGDGARVEAILAQLSGRRAVPTDDEIEERAVRVLSFMGWRARRGAVASADIARALLTDTSPPPVSIRRIEREAPPPRELTADEIFGEGW